MGSFKIFRLIATLLLFSTIIVSGTVLISRALKKTEIEPLPETVLSEKIRKQIETVNAPFQANWKALELVPAPKADDLTLIRRLSLALTGAPPSLEEIRRLEALPANADPVQSFLSHLFQDARYHQYFAERLTRVFVGVEQGPFLVYRRRRLVNWVADELAENRPYGSMVHRLIASQGVWTTNPEANFITAAVIQNGENRGPDETKLAARTSRAFLGISLDCMQCHDDKFGDHWKQEHFHQLAAFYSQAEMSVTGVRENRSKTYEVAFLGEAAQTTVHAAVPFQDENLPSHGDQRSRLAQWITHRNNRTFARATVNRTWAFLTGRPLHSPVDEIPLDGPFPAGMEELADFFIEENHNLQALIRMIAASEPFQRDSRSADPSLPVTKDQESAWAAFPITPLRSEQVAGSVIQASSLHAIDQDAHLFSKIARFGETRDFVKRYGDQGEDEFAEESGTIPQRLLLMNGKLVAERTNRKSFLNSSTRISNNSPSEKEALNAAFLSTLARYPSEHEEDHFLAQLFDVSKNERARSVEDIFWALINSTEFS
ncbi:MAG: DUF1549 domain-containing protein, partial [Verrucomicrobiota bacterium]